MLLFLRVAAILHTFITHISAFLFNETAFLSKLYIFYRHIAQQNTMYKYSFEISHKNAVKCT